MQDDAGMNGAGEEDGVNWRIEQIGDRHFRISVSGRGHKASREYRTSHPTLFGLDVEDHAMIEQILDELLREARAQA